MGGRNLKDKFLVLQKTEYKLNKIINNLLINF